MNRLMSSIIFIVFTLNFSFAESADSLWKERGSVSGAKANYTYCKKVFSGDSNYDSSWQFARAAYYYADNYVTDSEMKKNIFFEGKAAAEIATNLGYNKVEGHHFLGLCTGSWAEANGVMNSLFSVGAILAEATKAINIDPSYWQAAPLVLRGRVYQQAPSVISAGDPNKAQADYEKALKLAPTNRILYRFYAELLLTMNQKERAREIIEAGLVIPLDNEDKTQEEREIKLLQGLSAKLQ